MNSCLHFKKKKRSSCLPGILDIYLLRFGWVSVNSWTRKSSMTFYKCHVFFFTFLFCPFHFLNFSLGRYCETGVLLSFCWGYPHTLISISWSFVLTNLANKKWWSKQPWVICRYKERLLVIASSTCYSFFLFR